MGGSLPKPVQCTVLERHASTKFRVGVAEMNGWRGSMEDAHVIHMQEDGGYFGILDGHGGTQCSIWCAKRFQELLAANGLPANDAAAKKLCLDIDQAYLDTETPSGSTGAMCMVRPPATDGGKYKIHVVEDACMGIGAKIKGRSPGTFGTINAFSMHPLKSLNVMGDGGMVATNNKKIFDWIKKFRNHGMIDRDHIEFWGVNMRLQPLQAIVALEGLKKINSVIKKRNENAKIMDNLLSILSPNLITPKRPKGYRETFALYMCLAQNRDKLLKYLIKNKIEAKIHYPIPLNKQNAVKNLKLNQENFKIANEQAKKIITLPIHQYLSKKQISYIAQKIKDFYKK